VTPAAPAAVGVGRVANVSAAVSMAAAVPVVVTVLMLMMSRFVTVLMLMMSRLTVVLDGFVIIVSSLSCVRCLIFFDF
jgi:hypothetical protein